MNEYLTIIYRLPDDSDVAALTSHENAVALSWSHMMDERDRLAAENEKLKAWKASTWQRGHAVGIAGMNDAMKQMGQAKEAYLEENERLTNLLLQTEETKDRLAVENKELREALEFFTTSYRALVNGKTSYKMPEALKMADAALAKVKESGK